MGAIFDRSPARRGQVAHKIARAQQAGAKGVIVYSSVACGEALVLIGDPNPVSLLEVTNVDTDTLAVFVQRSTGLLLRNGTPPVTASAAAVFNGLDYLRFYDIKDLANLKQLSTFATANTNDRAVATQGTWSVHTP